MRKEQAKKNNVYIYLRDHPKRNYTEGWNGLRLVRAIEGVVIGRNMWVVVGLWEMGQVVMVQTE